MASTEDTSTATVIDLESDEWELIVDDDGFVYKRKRRRLDPDHTAQALNPAPDPGEEKRRRRQRKRQALLKLREKHVKEIALWEHLTGALRTREQSMKERDKPGTELMVVNEGDETAADVENNNYSVLDELLLKVEAEEAMIHHMMNMCVIAEALCDAHEEEEKQLLTNLPVWGSPRKLLSSLCEEE